MYLTDTELMMLEQLTYLSGINSGDVNKTIGEILSEYTEEKLVSMENSGTKAADRAATIRYIQSSEKMNGLVLESTMTGNNRDTLALCFSDSNESGEAIVAFRGTSSVEWGDNVEGLSVIETPCQVEAREYIESLPYDSITVTGHSKGGNKAMFVAISSDKVDRCVAMDAQGFSREFIESEKYSGLVAERANLIKNYSVKTDYVHALLFQIPGSEQIYCQGFRIGNDAGRHHEAFTFFEIDGDGLIVCNEDGSPRIVTRINGNPIKEDPSVEMLHNFTVYALNVATPDEKQEIVELIATAADMTMGQKCSLEEIADYLLNNPERMALVMAYLVKYMDTYGLDSDDIDGLLEMLGFKSLDEFWSVEFSGKTYGVSDIVTLAQKNLTDGKDDPLIEWLLSKFTAELAKDGISFDLKKFWKLTETKIKSIRAVSRAEGLKEPIAVSVQDTSYGGADSLIIADTAKLRAYADRLRAANNRLVALDKRLDSLYVKVGLMDLFRLIKADIMTGRSGKLSNCRRYLEETANDIDRVEREISNLF